MSRRKITYLVVYDISSKKRLGRVHRFMRKHALPVQYSVFVARVSKAGLLEVVSGLRRLINKKHDDVRVYSLPDRPQVLVFGDGYFTEGINLMGLDEATGAFVGQLRVA